MHTIFNLLTTKYVNIVDIIIELFDLLFLESGL